MRSERIDAARACARMLLHRFGVDAPAHIRIEAFANRLGVQIVCVPLDGADAQLVRTGRRTTILISDRITDPAPRRFSIAHELGHFMLRHPTRPTAELAGPERHWSNRVDPRNYEAEANAFASELLMPEALVGEACHAPRADLEVPQRIAREYNVSILASAIRFTELARERCAAVFSADGKVKWFSSSSTFDQQTIRRGRRLAPSSVAFSYFDRGSLVDTPQAVPAGAWLDTTANVEIVEHSICSRELGTVLSMLWIPAAVAPQLEKHP